MQMAAALPLPAVADVAAVKSGPLSMAPAVEGFTAAAAISNEQLWPTLVEMFASQRSIAGMLAQMTLRTVEPTRLVLECPATVLTLATGLASKPLAEAATKLMGRSITVAFVASTVAHDPVPLRPSLAQSGGASVRAAGPSVRVEALPVAAGPLPPGPVAGGLTQIDAAKATAHPLVRKVIDVLGARVTRVVPRADQEAETMAGGPAGDVVLGAEISEDANDDEGVSDV